MLNVISLGAGVQSTTMALMAAHGEITPMPDCAIFADTGWEPKAVYDHLAWLMSPNVLPFPVHVVRAGNIRESLLTNTTGQKFAAIPWHLRNPDGTAAMGRRQCTNEYKLVPLHRKVRELIGLLPRKRGPKQVVARVWIGISTDEIQRMKMSRKRYVEHRFPLVDARMNRNDCLRWMEKNQYPKPPKSSCIGCPFHSDAQWREIRDGNPAEWADAVEADREIRNAPKIKSQQFMHRSLVPLDQVDLSTAEDRGQGNLFNAECEGMCGV